MDWIKERHKYWWNFLMARVTVTPDEFDGTLPEIRYTTRIGRVAGRANGEWCQYNLAYAIQEGKDSYDVTICHEICHVFSRRLLGYKVSHGSLWEYLFNVVCQQKRGRYHSYSKPAKTGAAAQTLKVTNQLLKLQKQLDALEQ